MRSRQFVRHAACLSGVPRLKQLVDSGNHVGRKFPVTRAGRFFNLIRAADAYDRRRDFRSAEDPGDGEFRYRPVVLGGNGLQTIDQLQIDAQLGLGKLRIA